MKQAAFSRIPPGTQVRVEQRIVQRDEQWQTQVEGQVIAHDLEPTGSWYAHGKNDKFWLCRLRLKKKDGEITTINLDDNSRIVIVEDGARQ